MKRRHTDKRTGVFTAFGSLGVTCWILLLIGWLLFLIWITAHPCDPHEYNHHECNEYRGRDR